MPKAKECAGIIVVVLMYLGAMALFARGFYCLINTC